MIASLWLPLTRPVGPVIVIAPTNRYLRATLLHGHSCLTISVTHIDQGRVARRKGDQSQGTWPVGHQLASFLMPWNYTLDDSVIAALTPRYLLTPLLPGTHGISLGPFHGITATAGTLWPGGTIVISMSV